jgi:hypothetical protein
MMSPADTTVMFSVMPKNLAMSLMRLSFSSFRMVAGKLCWMVSRGELGQRHLPIAN